MIDTDVVIKLKYEIHAAFVFGSYAARTQTSDSDIDVLVLTDQLSKITAKAAFKPLGRKLNITIDVLAISSAEFAAIDQTKDWFWSVVLITRSR